MTRKFITIESADIDTRHQLRSALEENVLRRYGKKVMVIGMEYFPYDTFASNLEDVLVNASNNGEISQYTALFSNIAIFSSINDKIAKALNNDVVVICVGHMTQFTVQALTQELVTLFGPIADSGLFIEPCKMIHLVHDEEKWQLKRPENQEETKAIDMREAVNQAFIQTTKNLQSIESTKDISKVLCFEECENIMDEIMKEINEVITGPEPKVEQEPAVQEEPRVEVEKVDESDISFEEA